jgi:ribulose-5-phosphate 4-epimerase/fuculose-1-phosphate aldolase
MLRHLTTSTISTTSTINNFRFINHNIINNKNGIIRKMLSSSSSSASSTSTLLQQQQPNNNNNKIGGEIPKIFTKPQRELMQAQDSALSAQQRTMIDRILHAPVATTEAQIRKDLATAHRLMARYGFDDMVWNHISARCGNIGQDDKCCDISPDTYLITPGGMHFSEIAPEDLVFDSTAESGNVIHSGIYQHRPDVVSVIHAHTVPVMAVSALKDGFKFLIQDAAGFYGKLGYHDWEGLHDSEEEKERVAANLGPNGIALILRNHGAVCVGRSIQEAWVRYYYLDRCCRVQLEAMKTGAPLIECPPEMLIHAAEQKERFFPDGRYEWPALTRLVWGQPLHGRQHW